VLVATQEQLKVTKEKQIKAQAEAKELARVLAGGESKVTFPRGLEWAAEELSSVPYLDPGWLGLRVGEVVRSVVEDMLHLRRELQESRAREAEMTALLGEQAAAALLGVPGALAKASDAGAPSFLEPMGAEAEAEAAAAAGGAAYFTGVVRCRPELWSRGEVASCVRQLWAKRAQMEKTSTSAIPYPKVFRALKAEAMAQSGGGAGMGMHMGMLVASALNFEAALEALQSTDPALHLFLHVYRGAFSTEIYSEMYKEAMSLHRSVTVLAEHNGGAKAGLRYKHACTCLHMHVRMSPLAQPLYSASPPHAHSYPAHAHVIVAHACTCACTRTCTHLDSRARVIVAHACIYMT